MTDVCRHGGFGIGLVTVVSVDVFLAGQFPNLEHGFVDQRSPGEVFRPAIHVSLGLHRTTDLDLGAPEELRRPGVRRLNLIGVNGADRVDRASNSRAAPVRPFSSDPLRLRVPSG